MNSIYYTNIDNLEGETHHLGYKEIQNVNCEFRITEREAEREARREAERGRKSK